jgi:hypothetical protein
LGIHRPLSVMASVASTLWGSGREAEEGKEAEVEAGEAGIGVQACMLSWASATVPLESG